jgi:Rod binding domain-containing protein
MSLRVQPAPADLASQSLSKHQQDVAKVSREFEAILVRQMLGRTHVGGTGGGYADMAVEALASAVAAAGGLGLARAIEDALSAATRPPAKKE